MTEGPSSQPAQTPKPRGFRHRLLSVKPSDIISLVVLCIVAGLVLAAFRVDPAKLWVDFFETFFESWELFLSHALSFGQHAFSYFLLGAILVVPIWLVWRFVRALQR